jgi:hypothetical protein
MTIKRTASSCAWAIPTLLADGPWWLDANDCAWTCRRASPPRPLESTEVCADCPFWQARPVVVEAGDESWADRVTRPLLPDVIARTI